MVRPLMSRPLGAFSNGVSTSTWGSRPPGFTIPPRFGGFKTTSTPDHRSLPGARAPRLYDSAPLRGLQNKFNAQIHERDLGLTPPGFTIPPRFGGFKTTSTPDHRSLPGARPPQALRFRPASGAPKQPQLQIRSLPGADAPRLYDSAPLRGLQNKFNAQIHELDLGLTPPGFTIPPRFGGFKTNSTPRSTN